MLKWLFILPIIFLIDYFMGILFADFRELYINNLEKFMENYRRNKNAR